MNQLPPVSQAEVLARIPDAPTTLEFRDIALEPGSMLYRSGVGLILVHVDRTLAGATGGVSLTDVTTLIRDLGLDCEFLADDPAHCTLSSAIAFVPATIFTLDGPWRPVKAMGPPVIRPLAVTDSLVHLPAQLQTELATCRDRTPIFAAFVDGSAVSLAYSATVTETLADLSIDTLAEYRGRGLAGRVASALVDWLLAHGKAPVWGAADDNLASRRVAAKLGFRRIAGRLFVAQTVGAPQVY